MEQNTLISFRNIVKSFDGQMILKGVNLDINEKEFVTLLGPSGCGKTTLLRILGGFLDADEGSVIFDGEEISKKPSYERELNTVFQKYALFPHLSVYENIAFGLKIKKMSKDIIDQKVMKMLKLIGLEGYENKNTTLLSGGQQQRVAIARALVNEPKVLLLDEPLAALDLKLRKEMQYELKRIQQEVGITFIFVTHDQEEALTMSDKIVVMNNGEIQQVGTPRDLYDAPADTFVAGFIGNPPMNLLGTMEVIWPENKRWAVSRSSTSLAEEAGRASEIASDGSAPLVGVRPESLVLASQDVKLEEGQAMVHGILVRTEFTGATSYAFAEIAGGRTLVARLPEIGAVVPEVGESVTLIFDSAEALFFDPETGRRLSRLS